MSLTGCGGDKTAKEGATQTVTVWTNSSHTKDVADKLVAEYNAGRGKEKGITVEYTVHGADYQKVLDVAIQSEQAPDLSVRRDVPVFAQFLFDFRNVQF